MAMGFSAFGQGRGANAYSAFGNSSRGYRPPPLQRVQRPGFVQKGAGKFQSGPSRRAPGTQVPTAPGAAATSTPAAYPSPYDSTYFADLAKATFDTTSRINAYNEQSGYARTDLQNAYAQLAHQQPIDTLNTQESANRQGLLYSGALGNQLGELNRSYLTRQSADQQAFERGQAARDAAVAALRSGLSLTQAALAAAAAERASTAAQKDPTLGMTAAAPAASSSIGSAPAARGRGGGRGVNAYSAFGNRGGRRGPRARSAF